MDTVRFVFQNQSDSEDNIQVLLQGLDKKLQKKNHHEWYGRLLVQANKSICIYNSFTNQIELVLYESDALRKRTYQFSDDCAVGTILLRNGNIVILSQSKLDEFDRKGRVSHLEIDTSTWLMGNVKLAEKKNGNVLIYTKLEPMEGNNAAIFEYDPQLATLERKALVDSPWSSPIIMELHDGKIVCGGHNVSLIIMDRHFNELRRTKELDTGWGNGMYLQSAIEEKPGFVDCIGYRAIIRIEAETGEITGVYEFFGFIDLEFLFQLPLSNGTTAISYSKKGEFLAIVTEPKYLRKIEIFDIYNMIELETGVVLYVGGRGKIGIVDTETMQHRYKGKIDADVHVLNFIMG